MTPVAAPKIRVLFALPGLNRVLRGAEVAFTEISNRLAQIPGFEVETLGSGDGDHSGPRAKKLWLVDRGFFRSFPTLPFFRDKESWEEFTFALSAMLWLPFRRYDAIALCSFPHLLLLTRLIIKVRRALGLGDTKLIFITQNSDYPCLRKNSEFLLFNCDGLVCTNAVYYDRNREKWDAITIPNGADFERFGTTNIAQSRATTRQRHGLPPAGKKIVLMVSALEAYKRVDVAMRALAAHEDYFLWICGAGSQLENLKALGNELMRGRFAISLLSRSEMPSAYAAADIFLHLSLDEPSANAYVEALASGLPIVTHAQPITQATFPEHVTLLNTREISLIAPAIQSALAAENDNQTALRKNFYRNRLEWNTLVSQYATFIRRIVNR